MQNLILQPAGNSLAQENFDKTIVKGVSLDNIKSFLNEEEIKDINNIFQEDKLEIWGVMPNNLDKYNKTNTGDLVLFSANKRIAYIAQLAYKIHNLELADYLWGKDSKGETWEYLYFLVGGSNEDIPVEELNLLLGYKENNIIMGFNVLQADKAKSVLDKYGNFENALSEIKSSFTEPSHEEEISIEKKAKEVKDIKSLENLLNKISEETKDARAQEKIRIVKSVARNRKIVNLIKETNNYTCQICGYEGFEKKDGTRYAEVHHKEELAVSKWDHPSNMICVCANCHRKLHYGKDN